MSPIQQLLLTSGGASKKTYVDDLFSTQLWIGDAGTNRSINNGIDLSGEGGMVWFKRRNAEGANHTVYDTVRTATKALYLNSNDFGNTLTNGLKSFNSNGFTIGNNGNNNTSNNPYVAYSFRKAPGFFDVVTWTGNQTANRKISHSLGSVPGAIFIKRLGGSQGTNVSDWICYNRGSDSEQYPQNFLQFLNRNVGASNDGAGNYLYNVAPTADEFTIGSHFTVNASGNDYIAYVFAHDDQQFGEDGDESIILGEFVINKKTMKGIFGTDNWSEIVESLQVNPDADPPMIQYVGKVMGKNIVVPITTIGIREDGEGYGGAHKFEMTVAQDFGNYVESVSRDIFGDQEPIRFPGSPATLRTQGEG